jgi:hypothetical protein
VALAANLPLIAKPEVQARYQELIAAEGGSLSTRQK